MTQVRRLKGVNRIGGVIGRYGPNGDSGVWPVHARASDPYYDQVQLLLHMDGTDGSKTFNDSSKNKFTVTAIGDAQVDNGRTKFGESLLLDGGGDYLQLAHNAALNVGLLDFSIEAWIYLPSAPAACVIVQKGFPAAATANNAEYQLRLSSVYLVLRATTGGGAFYDFSSTLSGVGVTLNQWVHVAVSQFGSIRRLFVDGTLVASSSPAQSIFNGTATFTVGALSNGTSAFPGSIDEVRVTVGRARYQTSFTPPPRAFLP